MVKFQFSVVSNNDDYDNEINVIEFVEPLTEGFDNHSLMEKIVDDFLVSNQIPSGVPQVKGMVTIVNDVPILESYVVFNVLEKSFEFGVSLGEIEFVQNLHNINEKDGYELLEKLMEKNQFEMDNKTFGIVMFRDTIKSCVVITRPYSDDWSWDFDTDDTKVIDIEL
jgi:hypothetical protein